MVELMPKDAVFNVSAISEAEETRIFVTYGSDGMASIEVPRERRGKLESDLAIAGSRSGARTSN
ncbi:MAG: hypothetical protein WBW73_15640 [Rhodoplanes sp.]